MVKLEKEKPYARRDWPLIPILFLGLLGFSWCIFDLIYSYGEFRWDFWRFFGLFAILFGGLIEFRVRMILTDKAGFLGPFSTIYLKINEDHKLITDGPFKYVRHPLYSGVILQCLGFGLLSMSLYGSILLIIALLFLIPRIQIEENMLLESFGELYKDYQKTTKKIMPFIY